MHENNTFTNSAVTGVKTDSKGNYPLQRFSVAPMPSGQERISEAAKHGFKRAIVPYANMPKKPLPNMQVFGVKKLADALAVLEDL